MTKCEEHETVDAPLGDLPKLPDSERAVTVLAVSPQAEDHVQLADIFDRSNWRIFKAFGCRDAISFLRRHRVAVVISVNVMPDGDWKELFRSISSLPQPPRLVVAARSAPSSLWAEALNLGAYDVLSKPFDRIEVTRIVSLAWLHWKEEMIRSCDNKLP